MLTSDEIKTVDKSSICDSYDKWPEYCKISFGRSTNIDDKLFDNVNSIVFSGMGGSGTTGDILSDWMQLKCNVPVVVTKGYHIPAFVNQNTLFIAMSVSGNTEETLSTLIEAASVNAKVVGISHGGNMEAICKKKMLPFVKIEQRLLPRITLPEILFSVLKLLTYTPFVHDIRLQIDDSIKTMIDVRKKICRECSFEENPSKQLAERMFKGLPTVYCAPLQKGVGIRFKNSVNENAKINAITSELLDACHNELVSWGYKNTNREKPIFKPILVRSKFDPVEIKTRFDIFKEILEGNGHEVNDIPLYGSTPLANIISSLYLLDYSTIYLGILQKIDPTPITAIFQFKEEMKRRLDYFTRTIKPKLT